MKKILMMGITGIHNWGEEFLRDCTEYLIKKNSDADVYAISFEPNMFFLKKAFYYFILLFSKIDRNNKICQIIEELAVRFRCKAYFEKNIKDMDAVIFACGSLKYSTQKLWAYYILAVDIANKYDIPVMFSAMNIQKVDLSDYRCRKLKEHLNYPNVKVITTRDGQAGLDKLKNDYKIREDIICAAVGDVAFWIPECYKIDKDNSSNLVGINLINGGIFKRYGNTFSEEEMIDLYISLLSDLDARGIEWELFTNGLQIDYAFGEKIKQKIGRDILIRHPQSQFELLGIIKEYKVIYGARLHACIAAYSIGIAVVGMCWDEKIVRFSEVIGMRENYIDEGRLSSDLISDKLMFYINNDYVQDYNLFITLKNLTRKYIDIFVNERTNTS